MPLKMLVFLCMLLPFIFGMQPYPRRHAAIVTFMQLSAPADWGGLLEVHAEGGEDEPLLLCLMLDLQDLLLAHEQPPRERELMMVELVGVLDGRDVRND